MSPDASHLIARITDGQRREARLQRLSQPRKSEHFGSSIDIGGAMSRPGEKSRGRAATNYSVQRSNPSSTESMKQNIGDDGYPSSPGIPLSRKRAVEELSGRGYTADPSDPEGVQFPEGPDIYRNTPSSTVEPIFSQEPLEAPKTSGSGRPKAVSDGKVVLSNEYFRNPLSSPRQQTLYNPDTDIITGSQPVVVSGQTNKYDRRTHFFHAQNGPGDAVRHYSLGPVAHQPPEYPSTAHYVDDQLEQEPDAPDELEPKLLLQPETKAISHDQLVTEVRGIYAGLVMVEAKCIDVDEKQLSAALDKHSSSRLNPEQWQALIALHKTLLHEHHDFFLASQHPSASSALSHLAAKYSMPARMWKHGIHAFLEVLRHRLPESLDHMLAFIYIAYSMMALLFETVPTFEDTWIECLGDIARYRMAIEDDDIRDREVWSGVARLWYGKAADKNPNIGRLYHHLAILARPFTVMQLSLYLRAMTCIIFFDNAKSSIRTLFDPILRGEESTYYRSSSVETIFIKAHGFLFTGQSPREYRHIVHQLLSGSLDIYIGKITSKFKEHGACMAIANAASLFEYGVTRNKQDSRSIFRLSYQDHLTRLTQKNEVTPEKPLDTGHIELTSPQLSKEEYTSSTQLIALASVLTFGTFTVALRRVGDKNVYPLVHIYLVLIRSLINVPEAFKLVEMDIHWTDLGLFLTALARSVIISPRILGPKFPKPEQTVGRPLFEDFLMRGQLWSESYFPPLWFHECNVDDEERSLELASMTSERIERILWLAMLIVECGTYLKYSGDTKTFYATPHAKSLVMRNIDELVDDWQSTKNEADESSISKSEVHLRSVHSTSDNTRPSIKQSNSKVQSPNFRKDAMRKGRGQSKRSPATSNSVPQRRILMKNEKNTGSHVDLNDILVPKASQYGSPSKSPDTHASNVQRLDTMNISDPPEKNDSLIF